MTKTSSKIKHNKSEVNNKKIGKKYISEKDNSPYLEIFKVLPLLLIVGILPFVIRLKLIQLEGPFYKFWNGEKINADFFTYYKRIFIYIVTVWALLHTFLFTKKIKFTKAYYFMGGYAILVILSTIFSKYPQIALNGFVERKEGMWIILCYLLLMFATINLVETEKQIKAIIYTLGISGAVISVISIFQYYGMDIFSTAFAKDVMISKDIQAQIKEFKINFGYKYSYGVFYNPNYLGGYISFYAPLMLSFAIISKDIRERAIFSIFFALSIFALFGSKSEAGVLGTLGAIGVLLLVFAARYTIKDKPKEEHKKLLLTRFVPILLALIILPAALSYLPMNENPLTNIRTQVVALLKPSELKGKDYKEIGPINDIKQNGKNIIEVVVNKQSTFIEIKNETELHILGNNKEVLWEKNLSEIEYNTIIKIDNQKSYDLYLNVNKTNEENVFVIKYNMSTYNTVITFLTENKNLIIVDNHYKAIDIKKDYQVADYIGFEGRGSLGSNRGYLWSRSLPIVFDNLLVGTGQDTFVTEFPQHDIFARQVETKGWEAETLVDKPHNIFLQIGIHSGLLSLFIILIGLLILIIKSVKSVILSEKLLLYNIMPFSVLGFLLSSIFNDSILAITPIIYVVLGIAVISTMIFREK